MLGFASTFSRINIGIRHILIVYPFLALGGCLGRACAPGGRSWRSVTPRRALAGSGGWCSRCLPGS